jgi:hypothetical protein
MGNQGFSSVPLLLIGLDDDKTLLVSDLKTVFRGGSATVRGRHRSRAKHNQCLI